MALDMLRMEDIINYGSKCLPYLIPFLILLVAAVALVFVTKKKTEAKRKLIRSESVIAVILALALGVTGICMGPMYSSLSLVMQPAAVVSDETTAAGKQLSSDIGDEGVVLLKNKDGALPLTEKKLNVFGWASTNPCYGGTGSGGVDSSTAISLLAGLQNAGFERPRRAEPASARITTPCARQAAWTATPTGRCPSPRWTATPTR